MTYLFYLSDHGAEVTQVTWWLHILLQGSSFFATLEGRLTPVLQFKRVFYTFIKYLKGIKSIFVFVLLLNLGSLCVRAPHYCVNTLA